MTLVSNGKAFHTKRGVFILAACLLMLIVSMQVLFHPSVQAGSRPESPTNLVVVVLSATQIQLGWLDNSTSELGFVIYRSKGKDRYIEMVRTNANVTTYIDDGLSKGTSYYYRIKSFNSFGLSDFFTDGSAVAGDTSLTEEMSLKLQMMQDRRQKTIQTLSNIIEKTSDTASQMIQNLK
jgi:hypothetical protein